MSSDSDSESDDNGQGQFTFPYKPHRYSSSSVEDSAYQSSSTSLGQRSRSSSSGEDDSEEGGSDQSDSNPGSPVYHSPEEQQWYPYSTGRTFRPSSSTSDDYEMSKNEESPFVGQRHVLEVNQPMDSPSVENSSDEESPPEVKQEPIEERKRFFPPSGEEDDEEEPPKKKMAEYSDFSKRMMSKMGHRPGEGLGRTGEGIVEPIKESVQRGRVGLGAEGVKELLAEEVKWEEEEVSCREHLEWIKPCTMDPPTKDDGLDEWVMMGMRKETIKDETMFCDEQVLEQILKNKSVFDDLDHKAFLDARERSNPFEQIKGVIFQNRAAMKMANIDAVFDFMFTGMKNKNGKKITDTNDVLYFADICSGPGGFSEYVLFRTQWHAKGFGFTLKDPSDASDFKLDEFKASDCETFEPYYGVNGDGDITNTDNMTSLQERVFEATHGAGVHFVMGDGGISVEGEENKQELLTKQLVMCQFACALSILRRGGHFVCQIFDMFTPFLVGLIYLLYRCFDKVCIIKPVTSRPANSERYVVCKGFRNDSRSVADYLFDVNDQLNELKDDEEDESDVLEVVPLEVLQQEEEFMTYVTKSNDRLGKQQCIGLKKIQYFVKNRNLLEERQSDVKEECLRLWHIKNDIRKVRVSLKHMDILDEFWKKLTSSVQVEESTFNPKGLSADNLPPDIYTWKWYYTCGSRYLTVGAGVSERLHCKQCTVYIRMCICCTSLCTDVGMCTYVHV
jgi:cap1 methyltransferase